MLPHDEIFDAFFLFIFTIIGVFIMAWHVTAKEFYAKEPETQHADELHEV